MYKRDLFGHERITQMANHYVNLLQWLVLHPQADFRFAGLMTAAERETILLQWNRTEDEFPRNKCLHELFDEQVARTPGAIAAISGAQQISYSDLKARADRLAFHLQEMGVGPEARVGLFTRRNLNMLIGVLGVLKAGAAYVPLDANLPLDRILSILADAAPTIVLTESELLTRLPGNEHRYVAIDFLETVGAGPGAVRSTPTLPQMAAYVLYTSGSTGRPKGVVVEHRQVMSYVHGVVKRAGYLPGSSFAMVQPLAVDSTVTFLFSGLCHGGTLHLLNEDTITDPEALGDYLVRQKIDYLKIAPSHLAALQAGDAPDRFMPRACLVVGGEASTIDWFNAIQNMAPNCRIFNHYGPTETTVGVVMYRHGTLALTTGPAPLGTPMANARIYVLDRALQPVPVGSTGELYVAGESLSRGYLNRPGATAERFIANPFGPPGSRFYRTGDLGRWRSDGNLEFLGRADSQLKVRGYRVELAEIEAALRKHPLVQDAVVIPHGQGEQRYLVAYVVPHSCHADAEPLAQSQAIAASADRLATPPADEMKSSLREHLRQALPAYMVPSAIMVLKSWPLTPHGKLDRMALPDPELGSEVYHPPETQFEELICRAFAEVLSLERVSIDDNLFELGAHSLAILRIRHLLRARSGHDIPIVDFFAHPSVRALARRMEAGVDTIKAVDSQERAGKLKNYLRQRQTAVLTRNESKAKVGE
jgi:amino acid adenylation domain-containing protein